MSRSLALCVLLQLTLMLEPRPLFAQPSGSQAISKAPDTLTAEARARFDEGVRAATKGDFEAARVAFKQAYALKPVAEVMRNLGAAEVMSGHDLEGARHLTEYLAGARDLTNREHDELTRLLREAEGKLGRIEVRVDVEGASITVGGEAVGTSPLGRVWHVAPGEHAVGASKASSGEARQTVRVAAGALKAVVLQLQPESRGAGITAASIAPAEAAAGSRPSGRAERDSSDRGAEGRSLLPAVIGGGLAAVGLGLGVVWRVGADSDASDAKAILGRLGPAPCGAGTPHVSECAEVRDKNDSSRQKSNWSTVSFAVGGAALVGTVAYLLWPQSPTTAGSLHPSARMDARGVELGLEGRFF